MTSSAGQAKVEDDTIVVHQSTDREGSTFSLSRDARRTLQERFGDKIHFTPRIFIAHETRDDLERLHGSLAKQLVALLTGLSDEHVAQVAVEFRDPVTDRSL
jgi:CRP-like cAMP-binding protein